MAPEPTGMVNAWFPVITLLLGFVAASVSDWLRDRRTSRRELEARGAAKREQRFERRANFQRQTLLELQDAVMRLVRTTGEMHHQDAMAFRATGKWHKQLYGEDLSNRAHLANVQTLTLGVRVRDGTVRALLEQLRDACVKVAFCHSEEEGDRIITNSIPTLSSLNERIGEILRKLDDDEDSLQA